VGRDDLSSVVPVDLEKPGMHLAGSGCRAPTPEEHRAGVPLCEERACVGVGGGWGGGYLIAIVLLWIVRGSDHDACAEFQVRHGVRLNRAGDGS
jgi:hypothetical protein